MKNRASEVAEAGIVVTLLALFSFFILFVLFLSPIIVWLAWNVMDFGQAIGLSNMGFWGIIALAIFLAGSTSVRVIYLFLGFTIIPSLLPSGTALMHMPESNFKNFVAAFLLLLVLGASARRRSESKRQKRDTPNDTVFADSTIIEG